VAFSEVMVAPFAESGPTNPFKSRKRDVSDAPVGSRQEFGWVANRCSLSRRSASFFSPEDAGECVFVFQERRRKLRLRQREGVLVSDELIFQTVD
jgi:hypothetical protein